jgi:chemosensory pili system protein ChpA (sensor histidine kinase/response regulator)
MLQRLKPRILVIDDDPSIGVYISRVFGETGRYLVEVETDPIAAMATARLYQPDLLLLDIYMPGLSGLEIAEQLRAEPCLRSRPIIFFTGMETREMPDTPAEDGGPMEYLAKGVSGDEIIATVDRLLETAKCQPASSERVR